MFHKVNSGTSSIKANNSNNSRVKFGIIMIDLDDPWFDRNCVTCDIKEKTLDSFYKSRFDRNCDKCDLRKEPQGFWQKLFCQKRPTIKVDESINTYSILSELVNKIDPNVAIGGIGLKRDDVKSGQYVISSRINTLKQRNEAENKIVQELRKYGFENIEFYPNMGDIIETFRVVK